MNFWNEQTLKEALENASFYNFPENWSANGLVIWQDNFVDGNMIMIRTQGQTKGMIPKDHEDLISRSSALIAKNAESLFKYNKPLIELKYGNGDALIKLSRYIRKHFKGKVIGVTGSSGKSTTTQMIYNIFSSRYKTNSNIASKANTTWGIAWNMTRFNADGDYWVIETSLGGGMSRNSAITKPYYGIVMNVAPVHLTGEMTLKDIAEEKSRIFHAMEPKSTAIIYKEMMHFDIVKSAAEFKDLNIITFGESEDADIRIISDGENKFVINGETYVLNSEFIGKHILLDMAAALAVVVKENFDIQNALEILRKFKTLEGRGETSQIKLNEEKQITLVDESYNANPLSMKSAIIAFGGKFKASEKVLVLGDMAECGEESEKYHRELAQPIDEIKPKKVILCGKDIKVLYDEIKDKYQTEYFETFEQLNAELINKLNDEDCVLIKSSHSGNLHKIVSTLKNIKL